MITSSRSFVYAANNRNGFLCGRELARRGFVPRMLLLHPVSGRKWGDEICSVFPKIPVAEWGARSVTLPLWWLLTVADTAARTVIAPQQLPVGVLTALIGVPVFLFLLARHPR